MKRKQGLLFFISSCIPGCGQMHQGYMKRGMSLLTVFCGIFAIAAFLNIGALTALMVPVWLYAFFDSYNLRTQLDGGTAPADAFLLGLDQADGERMALLCRKRHSLVGWGLVLLGVYVLFETVVKFQKPQRDIFIEEEQENGDGLNFLAGKPMSFINEKAFEGTVLAHTDGRTPNLVLEVPEMNETELGYLIYFFEKACAVSGYMLGVNPFDQPGVESYKKNMFALLGKPGYEDAKAALEARLGQ